MFASQKIWSLCLEWYLLMSNILKTIMSADASVIPMAYHEYKEDTSTYA